MKAAIRSVSHPNLLYICCSFPPRFSFKTGVSGEVNAEQIDSVRGHLVVAGLPLLDEDIDVIVHVSTV